jgi:DNA repair protein RadC
MNLPLYGIERKKNLPELYEIKTLNIRFTRLESYSEMVSIMKHHLKMDTLLTEHVYILCLMNDLTPICIGEVSSGTQNTSIVPVNIIATFLALSGAEQFVVFHNHTNKYNISPSIDDINTTFSIKMAASYLGVKFLEHIIIGRCKWYMIEKGELH